MGGQAAEQIIAGVVLSERLAVTMYGAIHRASWGGQRNLRGLVLEQKLLDEAAFRTCLDDTRGAAAAIALSHDAIVPTIAVESGGSEVVVVTRGGGRYVTVQDLIASARANRSSGGKLALPVAAAIGKAVVEALAAAHRAGVVHGAVHPRSVLIAEDGTVRLGDFVVGRALTTAVAQGADSALWRGLSGFLAPELVVGEEPAPPADVFAAGAMLFTMLSGEAPPGTLHVTPAVERLVQRALDTDLSRRYKNAKDLLDNLLEAFEDDRWQIASPADIIKAAGLGGAGENLDEATEDLLAALGSLPGAVQVTPIRPSMDLRAAQIHARSPTTGTNRLDALLADLDDTKEHTHVDDAASFKRDPISEIIAMNPRKGEAIMQPSGKRVPSLDDPDDVTPLPAPSRDSADDVTRARPNTHDEAAAMAAIAELDAPISRVTNAAEQATHAAEKLEAAAKRAEEAAEASVRSTGSMTPMAKPAIARPVPVPDIVADLPPPKLRSRWFGIVALLVVAAAGVGFYLIYQHQQQTTAERKAEHDKAVANAEEQTRLANEAQADMGTISVTASPPDASVWLKLGRTNTDSMRLSSAQLHELRFELDGYEGVDTQVLPSAWSGEGLARKATVAVALKQVTRDKAGKITSPPLPAAPAKPPAITGFTKGEGPVHLESTPQGAEVWLLIGFSNTGASFPTVAGRAYELRVLADGYLPGYASISADDWREPGSDPKVPIDVAKKLGTVEKRIELVVDPAAPPDKKKTAK
ncbi:MAG TPA: protein kinase [Kofleriaceae bacterium]